MFEIARLLRSLFLLHKQFQIVGTIAMSSHRAGAERMTDDRGYVGHLIRGEVPYKLLEEGVRNRITNSYYFKEQCFGLNAATLCDRAVELRYIGGTYASGLRASPFLCLVAKMLDLNLERGIVDAYLNEGGEDFKYLRALAAFYIRLTEEKSENVYKRLGPLLEDKRKLRVRGNNGFRLSYMDEFVDELFTKERVCATSFWKLVSRNMLEEEDKLEERVSPVQDLLDEDADERSSDGSRSESRRSSSRSHSTGSKPNSRRRSHFRSLSSQGSGRSSSRRGLPNGNVSSDRGSD